MLLPLHGAWRMFSPFPQGVALGYVLLGFQPVSLLINESLPDSNKTLYSNAYKMTSTYLRHRFYLFIIRQDNYHLAKEAILEIFLI